MKTDYELKIWDEFIVDVAKGKKPFELRKDDRPYKVGETVKLNGWFNESSIYSGREVVVKITYILRNAEHFGLMKDHCIMGIEVLNYNF